MNLVKLESTKDGLSSISLDGTEYIVSEENTIEVSVEHIDACLSHGFKIFEEKESLEFAEPKEIKEVKNLKKGKK